MLAAATDGGNLNALYPAAAAIIVAIIGVTGNIILSRRKPAEDEDNVITALASALAAETEARKAAEERAIACEAREQARRRP